MDVDSRSISEQKEATIELWERKFSAPDTQLYPTPVTAPVPAYSPSPVEYQRHSDDSDTSSDVETVPENESTIEREIRLEQEREKELKRQRRRLVKEHNALHREVKVDTDSRETETTHKQSINMPIYKLHTATSPVNTPTANKSSPPQPLASQRWPQTYQQMTEVDRDSLKRESIIEREIRQQLEREEELRAQDVTKTAIQHRPNKVSECCDTRHVLIQTRLVSALEVRHVLIQIKLVSALKVESWVARLVER